MPTNESKTPMTDELINKLNPASVFDLASARDYQQLVYFARTLELKLSTLTEENKKLKEQLDHLLQHCKDVPK